MRKIVIALVSAFLLAGVISAADAPPENPFAKYDKQLKKLEDQLTKEKDKKKQDKINADMKSLNDRKDKELKKLTTPYEAEREKLATEVDKTLEKDKNADVAAKKARLDYIDKILGYYNDLYAGKTAEMPKDPAKTPAPGAKDGAKTDTPPAANNPEANPAEKGKQALSGDLAK